MWRQFNLRIRNIRVNQWRHFENIELQLEDDTALVCVVGANGTGKRHLLELIAACAHRLGLSQGVEVPRGDPFDDRHDFSLQFYLAPCASEAIDQGLAGRGAVPSMGSNAYHRKSQIAADNFDRITAGGIAVPAAGATFSGQVVERLRQSKDVQFLSLGADRAYPKKDVNVSQMARACEIDWGGQEYTRGHEPHLVAISRSCLRISDLRPHCCATSMALSTCAI